VVKYYQQKTNAELISRKTYWQIKDVEKNSINDEIINKKQQSIVASI